MQISNQIYDNCQTHTFTYQTAIHTRMNVQKINNNFPTKTKYTIWKNDLNLQIKGVEIDDVTLVDNTSTTFKWIKQQAYEKLWILHYNNDNKQMIMEFIQPIPTELQYIHIHFIVEPKPIQIQEQQL